MTKGETRISDARLAELALLSLTGDPAMDDDLYVALRELMQTRKRLEEARELLQELRGDDKRLGWIDCLDSYYYGADHSAFCNRLDAWLAEGQEDT